MGLPIPGFRSDKKLNKIIASIAYFFIGLFILGIVGAYLSPSSEGTMSNNVDVVKSEKKASSLCPNFPNLADRLYAEDVPTVGRNSEGHTVDSDGNPIVVNETYYYYKLYKNDSVKDGFENRGEFFGIGMAYHTCMRGESFGENINYLYCDADENYINRYVKTIIHSDGTIGETQEIRIEPIFDISKANLVPLRSKPDGVFWEDRNDTQWYKVEGSNVIRDCV